MKLIGVESILNKYTDKSEAINAEARATTFLFFTCCKDRIGILDVPKGSVVYIDQYGLIYHRTDEGEEYYLDPAAVDIISTKNYDPKAKTLNDMKMLDELLGMMGGRKGN